MSRLLFVFDIGFDRGGPSVHLLQDVIREGLNHGNEIEVILKKTGGQDAEMPTEFSENAHFTYFTIDEKNSKKSFIGRYFEEIKYARKCSKLFLKRGKYDAVFLQSNVAAYFYMRYLKKLGCRIVFNVQDIFPYNLKFSEQLPLEIITFPVFRKLQNMGYKMADSIITISDDMKQTLIEDGVDENRIEVIYNWSYSDSPITLEDISPANFYDLKMDHDKFNVVYAGNIGKMQNVELIAKTARELRDDTSVQFYVIGDGSNKKKLENISNGLKNIIFLPFQPSFFAESIYAQADLNVIPLMPGGIKTALPSKTATVLRVNKPVAFCVGRDNIFARLVEDDERVFFTETGNPQELVEVIKKLRSNTNTQKTYRIKNMSVFSTVNAKKYIDYMVR